VPQAEKKRKKKEVMLEEDLTVNYFLVENTTLQ